MMQGKLYHKVAQRFFTGLHKEGYLGVLGTGIFTGHLQMWPTLRLSICIVYSRGQHLNIQRELFQSMLCILVNHCGISSYLINTAYPFFLRTVPL